MKDSDSAVLSLLRLSTKKSLSNQDLVLAQSKINNDLNHLTKYGLGPLCAYIVELHKIIVHEEIDNKLNNIKLTAQYLNTSKSKFINKLSETGIFFCLLKGASLIHDIYPELYIRLMGDVDILINTDDAALIMSQLSGIGCIQKSNRDQDYYKNHHHLEPYYCDEHDVWLEVHTGLLPNKAGFSVSTVFSAKYFLNHLECYKVNSNKYYRPVAELILLHTIVHWCIEFRLRDSAIQLADIIFIINNRKNELDWGYFASLIDNRITATCVKVVFSYLCKHKVITLDENILSMLVRKPDSSGFIGKYVMTYIITQYLRGSSAVLDVIGSTTMGIVWSTYLNDNRPIVNTFKVLKNLLSPANAGVAVNSSNFGSRLRNLINRMIN